MAGLNYYIKLPGYETKDVGLDVSPIQKAAEQISKSVDADRLDAYHQRSADISQQNADTHQQQVDQQAKVQDQALEEKKLQQTGGLMQFIKSLPEGDPRKEQLWGSFVNHDPEVGPGLKQAGLDPMDHKTGVDFMLSKVTGYQDDQKRREINAKIEEHGARSGYYDSLSQQARARGDASTMNAESRRLKALGDVSEKLGLNPTRDEWEAPENQGFINAAFGGPMPFERAKPLLVQAQQQFQGQFEPDAEEKAMGITREHKIDAMRQQKLREMHGIDQKTLVGKNVKLRPDGSFEPITGANTVGERNQEVIARQGLERLDAGEKQLADKNTGQQFFGDLTGSKFTSGYGESGRGFRNLKAAIIDMNFALSGKSVSNAERKEFLDLYMPHWSDSRETQRQKIGMVRSYFKQVIKMRNGGASEEELKALHDRMLVDGPTGGDEPPAADKPKNDKPKTEKAKKLYDKYNLE